MSPRAGAGGHGGPGRAAGDAHSAGMGGKRPGKAP